MALLEFQDLKHARFQEVDVLRGLAALTVVFSHYNPYWDKYFEDIWVIVPNAWGYYAVKLFFIISGFVIFVTLERCSTATDFVLSRFSRIYPAYWATLLFVTLVSIFVLDYKQFWLGGLLANFTMFQEFFGYRNFDNVYWSLTVELAFYINAGCLFFLGYHHHIRMIVITWLVISCIWALTMHEPWLEPGLEDRSWLAMLFVLDYSPYFSIGIVLYDVFRRGWTRFRAGLITLAIFTEFLIASWEGFFVACFTAGLMTLAVQGYLKFLVNRITLWLGTISFSLYLLHRNLGYAILTWMHKQELGPVLSISIMTGAVLILATIFTYTVEKPSTAQIRSVYKSWAIRKS